MNKIIALSTAALLGLGIASQAFANDLETNASASQVSRDEQGSQLPWWWNAPANQGSQSYAQAIDVPHAKAKK
jgi:hypothetical protein